MTIGCTVSEIKLLFCALAGCTSNKTVHPVFAPCTLPIYSNNKWLKKCAHTGCTPPKIVHPAVEMCMPGAGCTLNFGHCCIFLKSQIPVGRFQWYAHLRRSNAAPYTHTLSLFMKTRPWWSLLHEEVHYFLGGLTYCSLAELSRLCENILTRHQQVTGLSMKKIS